MDSIDNISVEVTLRCSADQFWEALLNFKDVASRCCSDYITNYENLEGDGKSIGSVISFDIKRPEGETPSLYPIRLQITSVDVENMKLDYKYNIESMGSTKLKSLTATNHIIPNENGIGCLRKWTAEFETVSPGDVQLPKLMAAVNKRISHDVDAYLVNN